jgi:hypothetical protein
VRLCYAVREEVRGRGNIEKVAQEGSLPGARNRMPYFFATLRDKLGL